MHFKRKHRLSKISKRCQICGSQRRQKSDTKRSGQKQELLSRADKLTLMRFLYLRDRE